MGEVDGRAIVEVRSSIMPETVNRELRLRRRPVGRIAPDDFEVVRAPVPTAGPGEAVVRNLYLSLDPTNRIWVEDVEQYMPPVQLGDVMRGSGLGQVVESNDPTLPPGNEGKPMHGRFDTILMKRLRVQGFIVIDYLPRFAEAITQLAQWMAEGKLKHRDTIVDGLECAPEALNLLFDGGNVGKLIVKIADPPR